jgi:hypothetical protein
MNGWAVTPPDRKKIKGQANQRANKEKEIKNRRVATMATVAARSIHSGKRHDSHED